MYSRRPRLLDEKQQAEVCAILFVGATRTVAARYVKCSVRKIRETALTDHEFRKRLKWAESHYEVGHLTNIQNAAKKEQYWRAAAWALERKYPQRYALRTLDVLSSEQVRYLLAQFGEIVADEIADEQEADRVLARLRRLTRGIKLDPEVKKRGR
jgi:hypothetical protein